MALGAEKTMEGAAVKAADEPMEAARLRQFNADTLAYMGDAIYEKMVRERLLRAGTLQPDKLHHKATKYVSATAQARAIRSLYEELTEAEQAMVKRWRNHKYHSKAKHADPMTYKWATALEALTGYLYLSGDTQRLDWLFGRVTAIIEGEDTDVIR